MLRDIGAAFTFLSVLPLNIHPKEKPGRIFAYFPLVGLVLGLMLWACFQLPTASEIRAFGVLLLWVAFSGGLHLDGFADSCDGLLATTDPERRLSIMKDPQIGTWGAAGLILLLLGKFVMLSALRIPSVIIVIPVIARSTMTVTAFCYPYARPEGIGGFFREGLGQAQVFAALSLTVLVIVVVSILTNHFYLLGTVAVTALVILIAGRWASAKLGGGLTGDVYGAICEITELSLLLYLVVI